jgi:hypothetical protein
MKLYTEEQVVNATTKVFLESITFEDVNEVVRNLTPIELPSDEEIEKESKYKSRYILPPPLLPNPVLNIVYIEGAKWMRDKIQGGNNEQE